MSLTDNEKLAQRKAALQKLTSAVDEYVGGYEFRGDGGDYTPTETESMLITDAIWGLLEDEEFKAAYTSAIEQKHQAQIAMLVDSLKLAEYAMSIDGAEMPIAEWRKIEYAINCSLIDHQATADAFVAEIWVGAKLEGKNEALQDVIDACNDFLGRSKTNIADGETNAYENIKRAVKAEIAELRNQEGKDGK